MSPVLSPAASSAAAARNEVVVLPSVPVTPMTPSSRDGSPHHQPAASASAPRADATTSCGTPSPGDRSLDDHGGGAGVGRVGDVLEPVDVEAGDGDEQRPVDHGARVLGHAADVDRREGARPRRSVVDPGAPDRAGRVQPLEQPGERPRLRGRGGSDEPLDRVGLAGHLLPPAPSRRASADVARPAL